MALPFPIFLKRMADFNSPQPMQTLTLAENYEERELSIGSLFDEKFRIERKIGSGGMGSVYLATDIGPLHKAYAIKILNSSKGDTVSHKRFLEEARIMASLNHPNIISVFEFGTDKSTGLDYYVMEPFLLTFAQQANICTSFLHCALPNCISEPSPLTLSSILEGGKALPETTVIKIATQLLSAIDTAHSLSPPVVHRDIKPSNIIFAKDGRLLLSDFGIAKRIYNENSITQQSELTITNVRPGTWMYASPEQRAGIKITTASDYYSFGLVLFRTLTGGMPNSSAALPSDIASNVSKKWQPFFQRLLKDNPEDRLSSAKEIFEFLEKRKDDLNRRNRRIQFFKSLKKALYAICALSVLTGAIFLYDKHNQTTMSSRETGEKFNQVQWALQYIKGLQNTIDRATQSLTPDTNGVIRVNEGQTLLSGDIPAQSPITIFLDGGRLLFSNSTEDLKKAIAFYSNFAETATPDDTLPTYFFPKQKEVFKNTIIIGAKGGTLSSGDEVISVSVKGNVSCAEGISAATLEVYGFSSIVLYENLVDSKLKIEGAGSIMRNGHRIWFDYNNPL